MARITGKDGIIKIGDADVTMVRDWSLDETGDTVEQSVIGETSRTYKPTLSSGSGSLNLFYDADDTVAHTLKPGDEIECELYPEGETEGSAYTSFNAIVTSKGKSASFDGMTEQTIGFQVDGDVTDSTVTPPG